MNTYILSYHDDNDEVRLTLLEAESWQEAIKTAFGQSFRIKETYSLTEEEARECGFFINLKQLLRHTDGSYALRGIL